MHLGKNILFETLAGTRPGLGFLKQKSDVEANMSRASSTQLAEVQGQVDLHSWNLDICNMSRQDQVQLHFKSGCCML